MTATTERVAAESWFLERGLPGVLTRRGRWRRLWRRSAPLLAGVATVMVCAAAISVAAGDRTIDIDDDPSAAEVLILAVLGLMLPLAFLVGWLVSRVTTARHRRLCSTVAVVAMLAAAMLNATNGDRLDAVDHRRGAGRVDRRAHRARCRIGAGVGAAPDGVASGDHRRTGVAGASGGAAHRAGVLQRIRVVDGDQDQSAADVAGDRIHGAHRDGVPGQGRGRAGPARVGVGVGPRRRRQTVGRHTVRGDAGPDHGRSPQPGRTRQRDLRRRGLPGRPGRHGRRRDGRDLLRPRAARAQPGTPCRVDHQRPTKARGSA